VDSFAGTEFFAGKNFLIQKISGFEIFKHKNFRTKKFHVQKKSGFKNSDRENFPAQKISTRKKVRHVPQKIALQQQKDPKRIFRKRCVRPFSPPPSVRSGPLLRSRQGSESPRPPSSSARTAIFHRIHDGSTIPAELSEGGLVRDLPHRCHTPAPRFIFKW